MGSQYDENLNQNPVFEYIQENHSDILEKASLENWIICIPRMGTFQTCDITPDKILDQILIPGCDKDENVYYTLSRKRVLVKNKLINIDSVELFSSDIEILFEETFYIEKIAKYKIWCIDNPLFSPNNYCHSLSNKVLVNLHDCIDFLWCESLGHHILDEVKHIVTQFTLECGEIEVNDLQTQKELIGKLFSQCLKTGLKNEVIRKKCMTSKHFLENFKVAVETYMQFCMGTKLSFCISTLQHQKDSHLNKILRNSHALQYQDLEIPDKFSDIITAAKCEMSKLNNYHTVLDKVNCFNEIFNIIHQNKVKNAYVTTDDILQVLAFLLVKVEVNNWVANLTFLKEFRFSSLEISDQTTFVITSFEAVIEFLRSNQFLDLQKKVNSVNSNNFTVDYLYDKVTSIDMKLSSLSPIDSATEKKLCHPLCICSKCQRINDKNSDWVSSNSPNYNELGQNLLILSTISGKCEVVEYLLNQSFDVNCTDCFGKTSLHYAASMGYQNILLLLIGRQANVNARDNERNSPLHLACSNGHESCVKALIYSSPEVELNIGNFNGDTPLHLATMWGFYEIIQSLLENGASAIVRNERNLTALDIAPNYYVVKLFEKFLSFQNTSSKKSFTKTENVSVQDIVQRESSEHGEHSKHIEQFRKVNSLLKAIEYNDFPLTCFYLGFCNESRVIENGKCHPLCLCETCKKLQEDDKTTSQKCSEAINVNICNMNGYTPLHIAAKFGRSKLLRLLLDSGASVNVQTYKTLYTPLHLACIFQRIQIVRELLKCDCTVDQQDFKGNTALHYASIINDIKSVQILLDNGANCRKKNFFGRSPLQESEENMHYRIFKLMRTSLVTNAKTSNEEDL